VLSSPEDHPLVFVLPPWEQIYVNDEERDQNFAEAARVHDSLVAWYEACGYRVAAVPRVSVAERCNYILSELHASLPVGSVSTKDAAPPSTLNQPNAP
jgi:predicted ATPase